MTVEQMIEYINEEFPREFDIITVFDDEPITHTDAGEHVIIFESKLGNAQHITVATHMDNEITYFDPLANKERRDKDIAKLRAWAPKV